MGKRKTRKAPPKKRMPTTIPTSFDCPFCNHEKTVECKIDKDRSVGVVRCNVCDANFQMMVNYLSEPVDVYSEWVDQCELANLTRDSEVQEE